MNYTNDERNMRYVKILSELAARKSQVRALRKIAKTLYEAILDNDSWTKKEMDAIAYYEKEMK